MLESDPVIRQRLRVFWLEVLDELEKERDGLIAEAPYREPVVSFKGDVTEHGPPIRLPKEFIDKAAKAADQIRRDFPEPAENDGTPFSRKPQASELPGGSLSSLTLRN